uniref:Multidrug and toxin extrusion protein n=1 Tax=Periophthalmus magnuspinnatus TaxID=409849 RepID=A0A3B4AGA8_9GOBI
IKVGPGYAGAEHCADMETSSSDRLFCCPWLRRRVPMAYRDELYHILKMTVPVLITRILGYLPSFVNTMFCGRLGNNVMAGYGLACATINITTTSTGFGLAVACDTLVSQTFGGKNLLRVGVILQRSILILLLFCLPCWALLINAQAVLLCLGQDPEVARIAQMYMTAFIPAVPAMFLQQLQVSYLQNQIIILPQLFTAVAANIVNAVTNYILVFWLELGISGSAAANTMSHFYSCGFLFIYIWWKKLHAKTWGGWSMESLQEWGSYMKLAIASTVMKCAEWWVYEFGGFFAGMLSENDLAAQHGVIMIGFITYMFPVGIQAATCARVAIKQPATHFLLPFCSWLCHKIVSLISHLMSAYCFLQLFDAIVCVSSGIFVGTGRQKVAAVANIIGYYGIGLSVGLVLTFVAKLQTLGFWLGLLICVCLQSTFFVIVIIFKLNWKTMTDETVDGYKATYLGGDEAVKPNEHQGGGVLSPCQLLLRRGLVVLGAVAILAIGVSVRFLVPLPESQSSLINSTLNWVNTTDPSTMLFPIQQ